MSKESETVRRKLLGLVQCPKCKKDAKKGTFGREMFGRRYKRLGNEPREVCKKCNREAMEGFSLELKEHAEKHGRR